mmetsp:Transcript_24260/g.39610  ORF Transcript_24260/g.39610 Transcript_24260/m.39610 type:complete len:204 (+) Transcript_24260:1270-1881(+)
MPLLAFSSEDIIIFALARDSRSACSSFDATSFSLRAFRSSFLRVSVSRDLPDASIPPFVCDKIVARASASAGPYESRLEGEGMVVSPSPPSSSSLASSDMYPASYSSTFRLDLRTDNSRSFFASTSMFVEHCFRKLWISALSCSSTPPCPRSRPSYWERNFFISSFCFFRASSRRFTAIFFWSNWNRNSWAAASLSLRTIALP